MIHKELMQIMGRSISLMQDSVITQNRELVIIFTHPAPSRKPWAIFETKNQEGFKRALLTYDKVLDANTTEGLERAGLVGRSRGALSAIEFLRVVSPSMEG